MSGFKETEIGLIPEDWEEKSISDLFDIKQGKSVSKKNRIGNNQKPFLRTANVFWGRIDLTVLDEMNFEEKEEETLKLKKNDLLVCEGGDIGRTAILVNDLNGIYYQNHLHRLRVKNEQLVPVFFMYWMIYCFQYTNFYGGIGNKSTIPNLSKSRLSSLKFPLPIIAEQEKISQILSLLSDVLNKQNQIIQNLQELKKALMQKLFTEGLNSETLKDTEIGKIPESWKVSEIKKYINKTYQRNTNLLPDKEILYIDVSSISNSTFTIEYATKYLGKDAPGRARKVISEGDVIFATVRPTLKRIAIVNTEYEDEYCSTAFCVLRTVNDKLNNEYLYYYLQTDYFISEIGKLQAGASYPAVRDIDVKNMKIPVPKLDEQINIANVFKGIDEKIKFVSQREKSLNSLFNTLLNQLMTGIIRVKDLEVL